MRISNCIRRDRADLHVNIERMSVLNNDEIDLLTADAFKSYPSVSTSVSFKQMSF